MCRAFVGIKLGNDAEYEQHTKDLMLHYMINGHHKGNHEGYTFAAHALDGTTTSIRSLDLNKAMLTGIELPGDNVIHGHVRKASKGNTTEEFVHGWEFNGWTCSMNGTMDFEDGFEMKSGDNDSLHFFKMCFDERVYSEDIHTWTANIKKLAEKAIAYGNGALFFTNTHYTVVLNFNKTLYVHLMNRRILALNSNDDIHSRLDTDIDLTVSEKEVDNGVEMGLIKFESKTKEKETLTIPAEVPKMEDLKIEIKDSITVFDNSTGEAIIQEGGLNFPLSNYVHRRHGSPYSSYSKNESKTAKNTSVSPTAKARDKGKEWNTLEELSDKYTGMKAQLVASVEKEDAEELADEGAQTAELLTDDEVAALNDMRRNFPGQEDNTAREAYAQHILHDMDYI